MFKSEYFQEYLKDKTKHTKDISLENQFGFGGKFE